MANEPEHRALDGLRDLERDVRVTEGPDGSPGPQLIASIVLPGVAALRRRPVLALLLVALGLLLPLVLLAWAFGNRDDVVGFALDPDVLSAIIAIGLGAVVARLAAVAEVAVTFRRRPGIGVSSVLATLAVLVLGAPVMWAALRANDARGAVADVFSSGSEEAVFVPDDPAVDPDEVTNILLLGGDAGPGRWGMRTDTMILVTVHEESGRSALVSIPRNLVRLRFPPGTPLAETFPDGFTEYGGLANAVFTYVNGRPDLVEYYGRDGLQPEAVALSGAIGYSMGVEIDDYALVNMQGFSDVIDAVGGVTIELSESVPLPPDPEGEPVPASIGPGLVEMDGTLATAYARSRAADSDYERMQRQRQLLAALGSQVSPADALGAFGTVTGVLEDSMRTSLSPGEFSDLLDRLGDNSAIQESVGLVPPLVQPGSPDYDEIGAIVDAVQRAVVSGQPSGYGS